MKTDGNKALAVSLSTLLIVTSLLALIPPVPVMAVTTTISVDPPLTTVTPCEEFTVDIRVDNVTDLYGWQANITFNPSLMQCLGAMEGPFLKSGGPTSFAHSIDNNNGWVILGSVLMFVPSGVNGSGVVANVTFHCEGPGSSPLSFVWDDTFLWDSGGYTIPCEPVDGLVTQMEWYQKEPYEDYAQSGVPDFDQRQDENWTNPWDPYVGNWSWCGPTAVANSFFWMDSRFETGPPPPTYSDTFPLVQNYGPWDDKDPRNVEPLIEDLASLMNTDVYACGTNVLDMQEGIRLYLAEKGLQDLFYERTWECNFTFEDIVREVRHCEDVVLLLGIYQQQETIEPPYYEWVRVGGHYVTVAGVGWNGSEPWIKFSDPIHDYAEDQGWGPPYVPVPHPSHPTNYTVHNNATLVSHDPYQIGASPIDPLKGPIGCGWGPLGYDALGVAVKGGLAANGDVEGEWQGPFWPMAAAVEAAVIVSPITQRHLHHEDCLLYPINLHSELSIDEINLSDPVCTWWHELYPRFCRFLHLSSWEDTDLSKNLTVSDQIDMEDEATGNVSWYHVDWITVTLEVDVDGDTIVDLYVELARPYGIEDWEWVKYEPYSFPWHEKYPNYSTEYTIITWDDNGDGELSFCDWVLLQPEVGDPFWAHIEYVAVDMWVSRKPIDTQWHELYPEFCRRYHVDDWQDNGDQVLSPCDYLNLTDKDTGESAWYHVENVTITINATMEEYPSVFKLLELEVSPEEFWWIQSGEPLVNPVCNWWHEVYPVWCNWYHLTDWVDSGDPMGALSYCDWINLTDEETGEWAWYHVESVCTDIKVKACSLFVTNTTIAFPYGASVVYPTNPGEWEVYVNVTVENRGIQTETFNVTAYYDGNTMSATEGNPQTIILNIGQSTTVQFTWKVQGVAWSTIVYPEGPSKAGYYIPYNITISVCGNMWPDGTVTVRRTGDANGDGHCKGADFTLLGMAWWTVYPDPEYDPRADFNGDGDVKGEDFTQLAMNWYEW